MTKFERVAVRPTETDWDMIDELALDAAVEAAEVGGVLLIDDDAHFLALAARLIAAEGLRAICCDDPLMAVHMARSAQPEVIVLDLLMPEVDGWDVLTALRADPATRSIPIYMCSVLAEITKARRLGANGTLAKPLDAAQLRGVFEDCGPMAQSSSR